MLSSTNWALSHCDTRAELSLTKLLTRATDALAGFRSPSAKAPRQIGRGRETNSYALYLFLRQLFGRTVSLKIKQIATNNKCTKYTSAPLRWQDWCSCLLFHSQKLPGRLPSPLPCSNTCCTSSKPDPPGKTGHIQKHPPKIPQKAPAAPSAPPHEQNSAVRRALLWGRNSPVPVNSSPAASFASDK